MTDLEIIEINGVTYRFRWIPPGTFMMGSPKNEAGRLDNEGPQHEVTLTQGYWIGQTPVTQALWEAVMGDNPSRFKSDDHPVGWVSWEDCQRFIAKLNQIMPGLDFRLPTEAEWENACRAGTQTATWLGNLKILGENNAPLLDKIAWYGGNCGVDFDLNDGWDTSSWSDKQYRFDRGGTHQVAQKEPNPLGLYDVLGNVSEWCSDWKGSYSDEPVTNPHGPETGSLRVYRGGCWGSIARGVRAATRCASPPSYRYDSLGFRLARGQGRKDPVVEPKKDGEGSRGQGRVAGRDHRVDIQRKPAETETQDLMEGASRWEIKIHQQGFIALVDVMPRIVPRGQTADSAIVQAARVSYGEGTKKIRQDRGLIRYLLRHRHTTPFEMVEMKFHVRMPLFVARQWVRHRTASINEYSARYSIMPPKFYRPELDGVRAQSGGNRQGSDGIVDVGTAQDFLDFLDRCETLYPEYEQLVERGVSREQVRVGLPLSMYTEWYWKCDLHNIMHFLSLRMDSHAQQEIRDYADAMFALIQPLVPMTAEAFVDYRLKGLHLTRLEIEAIRKGQSQIDTSNSREQAEFAAKRETLGLGVRGYHG